MTTSEIGEREKIQILLAEYTSLRTEIIHRGNSTYQLGAIIIAAFALLVSRTFESTIGIILALTAAILIILLWRFITRDTGRLVRRVLWLEAEINRRAGEELLAYESRVGGAVSGMWYGFFDAWPFRRIQPPK